MKDLFSICWLYRLWNPLFVIFISQPEFLIILLLLKFIHYLIVNPNLLSFQDWIIYYREFVHQNNLFIPSMLLFHVVDLLFFQSKILFSVFILLLRIIIIKSLISNYEIYHCNKKLIFYSLEITGKIYTIIKTRIK